MRSVLVPAFLLVSFGTAAAAPPAVTSWRPQAWRPPAVAAATPAVRFDPDGASHAPDLSELAAVIAARRAALARVPVVRRADGSRTAVVGGLRRGWLVARVAEGGALESSCVETEAEAARLATPGKER